MAKASKKDLPKFEDFKAPWEVDADGKDVPADEQEVDLPRLKKLLFDRTVDKVRAQNALVETTERAEELEEQVANAADPEALKAVQTKLADAIKERDDAKNGSGLEVARLRIALEKGLTERQAKRLVGTDEDELRADADELLAEIGRPVRKEDEPELDDDGNPIEESVVRTRPRGTYRAAGDPAPYTAPQRQEKTPEQVVAELFANR